MSSPYVGEIRMFGGNFAPVGFAFCDGTFMSISQNDVLFALIGTTYGGDGQNTFALPNLQGRIPLHAGNGYVQGQQLGTETVTLTTQQLPAHGHAANAFSQAGTSGVTSPNNNFWGSVAGSDPYSTQPGNNTMNGGSVGFTGGSQPHENMMPYLCVTFIIALYGVFPSQT